MSAKRDIERIRAEVRQAFHVTRGMTLRQIAEARPFPRGWIEALGLGARVPYCARVWWKRKSSEYRRVPAHLTLDGERTLCGQDIPTHDDSFAINPPHVKSGNVCEHCRDVALRRGARW